MQVVSSRGCQKEVDMYAYRQPPKRPAGALLQRNPLFDTGRLNGVENVLCLVGEVALQNKDYRGGVEVFNSSSFLDVLDHQSMCLPHICQVHGW